MAARFTPVNQKRLTNVTVVRLKKAGKRFEIACYPNKVNSWRNKIETNLDEVLQSVTVFVNVSKGQLANSQDLTKAFNSTDQKEICLKILEKGEVQVSEKEREAASQQLLKDIVSVLSVMSLNSDTNRPFSQAMLERGLKDIHFKVKPNQTAKVQALEALKMLQTSETLKIQRADMRVRLIFKGSKRSKLIEKVKGMSELSIEVEEECENDATKMILLVNPSEYKDVQKLLKTGTEDCQASIDLLAMQDMKTE